MCSYLKALVGRENRFSNDLPLQMLWIKKKVIRETDFSEPSKYFLKNQAMGRYLKVNQH